MSNEPNPRDGWLNVSDIEDRVWLHPLKGILRRFVGSNWEDIPFIPPEVTMDEELAAALANIELLPGPQGYPGADGAQGIQGLPGNDGAPGIKGDIGEQGIQGIQGEPGTKGDQGDDGPQGYPGADGAQGITGDDGAPGAKGDKGDTGNTGQQGIQGEPGVQGIKGDTGNQGIQGVPGVSNYTIPVQALTSSPADGATVYFGMMPKAPATSANISKIYIRKAGTIKIAEIYCYSGTAGTAEAWSLYIRKNNSADTLIATLSVSANERIFSNTGLNIAVAVGDYIEIKGIQPTWATNPLTTIYGGYIYIE